MRRKSRERQDRLLEVGTVPMQPIGRRLAHFGKLFGRYWVSPDWKMAWFLLALFLGIQAFEVTMIYQTNLWQRSFYNSLEDRKIDRFYWLLLVYCLILGSQVIVSCIEKWVSGILSLRWRTYLSDWYVGRWLSRTRYYEIERLTIIDNPDQRISEDVRDFTSTIGPLALIVSIVTSIATATTLAVLLLKASQPLNLSLFGTSVSLPGDLLIYAVLYVTLGTIVIAYIGKPFIRRSTQSQHYEADYRASLIDVRRSAPEIAFSGSEPHEHRTLGQRFARLRHNAVRLIYATMGLEFGTGVYQRIGDFISLLSIVPRYFAGSVDFGTVMAGRSAFGGFCNALSVFTVRFGQIAKAIVTVNRLKALDDVIDGERERGVAFLPGDTSAGIAIATRDLALHRPTGERLLTIGDWTIRDGERWMVRGPSGAGKSTLLRAIAGLWPDGTGAVSFAGRGKAMLVPQRLYLPAGSLKSAVCFPDDCAVHDDATVARLLEDVGLGVHVARMLEVRTWQDELSPGEQQRVALARILLQHPDLVILDEVTSALDEDNAQQFYRRMLAALPNLTVISVLHDPDLAGYHDHELTVADGRAVAARIDPETAGREQ